MKVPCPCCSGKKRKWDSAVGVCNLCGGEYRGQRKVVIVDARIDTACRGLDTVVVYSRRPLGAMRYAMVHDAETLICKKPKMYKEVKKLLDKHPLPVVKCTPVEERSVAREVIHSMEENVSSHIVPHTHQEIVYRGNAQDFKDEIQRAYDNHPDPAFRGKVHLDNL